MFQFLRYNCYKLLIYKADKLFIIVIRKLHREEVFLWKLA
nr:MAG TPA: hypothetical protein [Caudoviricetes sp.]